MANQAQIKRRVDEQGRVWFSGSDAAELMLRGFDVTKLLFDDAAAVQIYNQWCHHFDKATHCIQTATDENDGERRLTTWRIAEPYRDLNVRSILLDRCVTTIERDRVNLEMDMFDARGLLPVLRLMFMLVDHFRRNNIVWGVGRGSSVASYVLFLIGVHKIDALAYDLDISEFLRD